MQLKDLKIITGWDDGDAIIIIHKIDGVRKVMTIRNFQWYFVIPYIEYEHLGHSFFENYFQHGIINKLVRQGDNLKIYANKIFKQKVTLFTLINALKKKNVDVKESDLSMLKRLMIDQNIDIEEDLTTLYFDIETDDRNDGIEIGRDTILSWAAYDTNGNVWFEQGDEKEILIKFIKLINKFDIISGWNSDQFDLPYIKERMQKYKLYYNWRKIIHLDMMLRCIKLYSYDMDKIGLKGFSLNEVSRVFLDEQKVKFEGGVYDLLQNDFETFKKYNIQDTKLLYDLDKKLNIFDLMIKECAWTGTLLNRFYIGELLDNYILREAKKHQLYLQSRPSQQETLKNKDIKIIGGYVKEPLTGLYSNVRVLDYKSLYPSIIVGWNIGQDSLNQQLSEHGDISFNNFVGPDRKIEDVDFNEWHSFLMKEKKKLDPNDEHYQTTNNNFFRKDISSFISTLVKHLLDLRKGYKKKLSTVEMGSAEYGTAKAMQAVVKEMANSMYGITADRNARYFDKHIAEGITLTGQFLNKASSAILEKKGHTVIYGDTDSVMTVIQEDDKVEEIAENVNADLIKFLVAKYQLTDLIICLEYEKAYKTMIMLDKKKYTGIIKWADGQDTDFLFSRGTEDVKRNTIPIAKNNFIDLIKMITIENKQLPYIKRWLRELKEQILNAEIPAEQLLISTKVSKPIHAYKSKSVHVRLAERLIKEGKLLPITETKRGWGTRLEYILIPSEDNKLCAVLLEEFDGNWDRKHYWDVQVYAPIMRVLQCVWPDENWEDHSIILFEKMQRKKEREKLQILREKEREEKKKEREKKKKERETLKIRREKEREEKKAAREKLKQQREKDKLAKRQPKQQKLL